MANMPPRTLLALLLLAPFLFAQPSRPFSDRAASSIAYSGGKEEEQAVETVNVAYRYFGFPPLRTVRSTVRTREVFGVKGFEGSVTLEAWPFGAQLSNKPLYTIAVTGLGFSVENRELWQVDREVDGNHPWWSIYTISTGRHLFDTTAELLSFRFDLAGGPYRYAGAYSMLSDSADARLRDPHAICLLTYASAEAVLRQVLISATDPDFARGLGSVDDTSIKLSLAGSGAKSQLRLAFEYDWPSSPHRLTILFPFVNGNLDVTHAQLPLGLHAAVFRP
jgi:hypothetical protein